MTDNDKGVVAVIILALCAAILFAGMSIGNGIRDAGESVGKGVAQSACIQADRNWLVYSCDDR